jgi:dihydrofolate synthase/folylpolyglutamate synthase
MYTRYESMVRKLYQINMFHPGGAVKYGLDNSFKLSKLLGSPMAGKPIIHVAGTNGKGSVSWKMARALREAGYRDGLFVSPHVASFRERVQVRKQKKRPRKNQHGDYAHYVPLLYYHHSFLNKVTLRRN